MQTSYSQISLSNAPFAYSLTRNGHSFEIQKFASPNTFSIRGWSTGTRAHNLYLDFLQKLDSLPVGEKLTLKFDLEIFDTTSTKYLFKIIKKLNSLHRAGHSLNITWIAEIESSEMIQTGIDFEEFCDFTLHFQLK